MSSINISSVIWAALTMLVTAVGSLFMLIYAHAGEPTHPMASHKDEVTSLQVRVEGIAADTENNKFVLEEVKSDLKAMQVEQRASTETILRAIRDSR